MLRDKRKRTVTIVASIAAVVLIALGVIALVKGLQPKSADPYKQTDTSSSNSTNTPSNTPPTQQNTPQTQPDSSSNSSTSSQPAPDPSTVSTIDITPMNITVSYVKGVGGFQYEVLRTPNGTQYVDFRSTDLIGTKCTDDQGTFASILANPQSDESATLAQTTTVDGVKYGLSLTSNTCTSDTAKLKQYQDSFSNAFSLLKKTN